MFRYVSGNAGLYCGRILTVGLIFGMERHVGWVIGYFFSMSYHSGDEVGLYYLLVFHKAMGFLSGKKGAPMSILLCSRD